MTETPNPADQTPVTPTRRDKLRPVELLLFATIFSVFAAAVVAVVTRNWLTAVIALGGVFIAVTMLLALVGLGGKPSEDDLKAREDLQRPEDGGAHWH